MEKFRTNPVKPWGVVCREKAPTTKGREGAAKAGYSLSLLRLIS